MICKNCPQENHFIECCRTKIWSLLMAKINCSIYGLESLIPVDAELSDCQSYQSASQTYYQTRELMKEFYSNFSKNDCPVPCTHKSFGVSLQYFNKNTFVDVENRTTPEVAKVTTGLTLAYSSLLIEERVETYLYDIESVMTSLGGNLVINFMITNHKKLDHFQSEFTYQTCKMDLLF